jgi:hypothetical protein
MFSAAAINRLSTAACDAQARVTEKRFDGEFA